MAQANSASEKDFMDETPQAPIDEGGFTGGIEGDVGMSDMKIPYLQITYGVGDLAKTFSPGDLVLGKEALLARKGEVIEAIPVHATVFWKEYVAFGGPMPRIFKTEEEVIAAGGCTSSPDWNVKKPDFSKAMVIKMLIKQPKDIVSGYFGFEIGGNMYAPAQFVADKLLFKDVGSYMLMLMAGQLKKTGLPGGVIGLSTFITTYRNGSVGPKVNVKFLRKTSDQEYRDVCAGFNIKPAAMELAGGAAKQIAG